MNLVVIVLDSFRQDHVSAYHGGQAPFSEVPACQTPNLDAFARESVMLTSAYADAYPTIPIRMQWFTGQRTLPFRPWQPLAPHELTIADILRREGYVCGLISDTYHFRAPGMNYHRSFHSYHWVRGQEYDPAESAPTRRDVRDYVNDHYPPEWRQRIAQYLANTDALEPEDRRFPAQVVDAACAWLERNRDHRRLFLWVDSFDPHEPWDPPARWDTYTDPDYRGPRLIMPMGGPAERWASPEQIRHIRGLYAGECAFVDHCLGRLFATLQRCGYYDDSLIVVIADHGHPLADHGKFLKGADRLYNELLRVPCFIRFPGGRYGGQRTDAIVQYQDLLPTLLEALAVCPDAADAMHGRSFLPVLRGERATHRTAIVTGYHAGIDRCIRDHEWSYLLRPEGEPDELYHLPTDPGERHNRIDEHPEEAVRLSRQFGSFYRRAPARTVKGVQGQYELASGTVE